jgi:hypothetical protein
MKIHPVGCSMRTDMTKLIVVFHKFCKCTYKWLYNTNSHQIITNRNCYTPASITLNISLSFSLLARKEQNHDHSHHLTGTLQPNPYIKHSKSDNVDP